MLDDGGIQSLRLKLTGGTDIIAVQIRSKIGIEK